MDSYAWALEEERYVIDIRRDIHKHPEISMQEERTMNVVTNHLSKMNISYEVVDHGGIIGIIEGNKPGKTIILRADLDALPMKESEVNLKKQKHVVSENDQAAHMCGHDGHTAMLLGAAKILAKNKHLIKGKVILAFEQGEENGKGIYQMVRRLHEIGADGIWGIHLKSDIPSGRISVDPGPRMAGAFQFHYAIKGESGHGSRPDLAQSPIDCFTTLYQHLQALKINHFDPFKPITYSIGTVKGGTAPNVIPETIEFSGTVRYLDYNQGLKFQHEFNQLLGKVCELHNCTYEFVEPSSPMDLFVYNEEVCAEIAAESVSNVLGEQAIMQHPAWMASEPFACYQKYFPGVFAFVGILNEEKGTGAEHHHPCFDIDEVVLKNGVAVTVEYAMNFLNDQREIPYQIEQRPVQELFLDLGLPIHEPES